MICPRRRFSRKGERGTTVVVVVMVTTLITAISIFAALGASGLMPPALAAWAPNLLFGATAAYLLLTVRT